MPIGPSEFVQRLVERVPEVTPMLDEHLLDIDELLLHVLSGEGKSFTAPE